MTRSSSSKTLLFTLLACCLSAWSRPAVKPIHSPTFFFSFVASPCNWAKSLRHAFYLRTSPSVLHTHVMLAIYLPMYVYSIPSKSIRGWVGRLVLFLKPGWQMSDPCMHACIVYMTSRIASCIGRDIVLQLWLATDRRSKANTAFKLLALPISLTLGTSSFLHGSKQ